MTSDEAVEQLDPTRQLVEKLRRRAKGLRVYALSILSLIVVVLAVGSWVFISADARALNDILRGTPPDPDKLAEVAESLRKLSAEREILIKQRVDALKRHEVARKSSNDINISNELRAPHLDKIAAIDSRVGEIDNVSMQLNHKRATLENTRPKEERIALTISALSMRVGAVVLLLFLVQILTPLFRYNMMLAAHYEACADGLDFLPRASLSTDAQVLEQVVRTMSPHTVGFGAAPQTPVERTLDVAAQVLARK